MLFAMKSFLLLAVAGLQPYLSLAEDVDVPNSAFLLNETGSVFAVSVPPAGDGLYITIVHPAVSWVGLGLGSSMASSIMMILYQSTNATGVTLSTRLSKGNVEPVHTDNIVMKLLPGSGVFRDDNGNPWWQAYMHCSNCDTVPGLLDVKSTKQPFIYAVGPDVDIVSDSPTANLQQHVGFGSFSLDMIHATSERSISTAPHFDISGNSSVLVQGGSEIAQPTEGRDNFSKIHGFLMSFAVLIVLPANLVFLLVVKSPRWQIVNSALFFALLVVGLALGIVDSKRYNDAKAYKSPHQVLGFVSIALFIIISLLFLPRLFASQASDAKMQKLHAGSIFFLIVLSIVTGGLGLRLSHASYSYVAGYIAMIIFITLLLISVMFIGCIKKRGKGGDDETKRAEEIELHIRRIQQIQAERGEPNPPPAYH